jgi:hypothetical protein
MCKNKENELNNNIINLFPYTSNKELTEKLGITEWKLRKTAKNLNIKKSEEYKKELNRKFIAARKEKYEKNIKTYNFTKIEQNIIIGSLLGDGSLALYGRSKNAHYREHGCLKQIGYRQWKCSQLKKLDFKMDKGGKIYSPSNPIYTNLYNNFYINRQKIINENNLKLLDHPIGLACLYMDDGTLVIDSSKSKNKMYLFPRIAIYSLNFSKIENEILMKHIKKTFTIKFKLKKRPDGKNYILELNQRNEIMNFIDIVKPYINQIPCMKYKIDIYNRLEENYLKLSPNTNKKIVFGNLSVTDSTYSNEEEKTIISLKNKGIPDKIIAQKIKRTYWGTVDKIRRLREEGTL